MIKRNQENFPEQMIQGHDEKVQQWKQMSAVIEKLKINK